MVCNVLRSRVIWRIAANVRLALALVHAHVVDLHHRREDHRGEVDRLPVLCKGFGQSQIDICPSNMGGEAIRTGNTQVQDDRLHVQL